MKLKMLTFKQFVLGSFLHPPKEIHAVILSKNICGSLLFSLTLHAFKEIAFEPLPSF